MNCFWVPNRIIVLLAVAGWLLISTGGGRADDSPPARGDDALQKFAKDAANAAPETSNGRLARGIVFLIQRDSVSALAEFNAAIQLDPQNSEAYSARGSIWVLKGKTKKAIDDFSEAIRLDPQSANAYCNRAAVWELKKEFDKAREDYSEAIRLKPGKADAFLGRAQTWLAREHDPRQQWVEENFGSEGPEPVEVTEKDGKSTKYFKNVRERALADLNEALRLDPQLGKARSLRGMIWMRKQEWAKAIADFDAAITLDPKSVDALSGLARVRATAADPKFRDGQLAVDLANRACELTKWRDAGMIETLAAAYAELRDFKSAAASQTKAVKLLQPGFFDRLLGEGETELEVRQLAQKRLELFIAGKSALEVGNAKAPQGKAASDSKRAGGGQELPSAYYENDELSRLLKGPARQPAKDTDVPLVAVVVDARGNPIPRAKIISLSRQRAGGLGMAWSAEIAATTDERGRFRMDQGADGAFTIGQLASLRIEFEAGHIYDVNAVVTSETTVQVPALADVDVSKLGEIATGEMAGLVVDEAGRPLEGVEVVVGVGDPHIDLKTNADGVFRTPSSLPVPERRAAVAFRKAGYSPYACGEVQSGRGGWVVVLGSRTYVEGIVRGPDGKPVPAALVQAVSGPKNTNVLGMGMAHRLSTVFSTTTDEFGHYRLYVQPDEYQWQVRVVDLGVARLAPGPIMPIAGIIPDPIKEGQGRALDIDLQPGASLRAKLVDCQTGAPAPGVRLSTSIPELQWRQYGNGPPSNHRVVLPDQGEPRLEAQSDDAGEIVIRNLLPGAYEFDVRAPRHVRWWSENNSNDRSRKFVPHEEIKWQYNTGTLALDVQPDMEQVTVLVERGVDIQGRVVDPDGHAVAGATIAVALTGWGDRRMGDVGCHATSDAKGRFAMLVPASHAARYNLVAHEGAIGEWRKWANGVSQPIRTQPGQKIKDLTLTLTRPAVVRGKVVDQKGQPVPDYAVALSAVDKLEDCACAPEVVTGADGTFEFPCVRPGEFFIGGDSLLSDLYSKSARRISAKPGQTISDLVLKSSWGPSLPQSAQAETDPSTEAK